MTEKQIDKDYWDNRYRSGGGSGDGGLHFRQQVDFKLKEVRRVSGVSSILDVGFGDLDVGLQVTGLFPGANYLGLEISEEACEKARAMKLSKRFRFKFMENCIFNHPSDLVLCLDVLWHINRDKDYEDTLESLKRSWKKFLFLTVYKDEYATPTVVPHIKRRRFDPTYFSESYKKSSIPFTKKICLYQFLR